MEKQFFLKIVTPDREFFEGNVESLIINTPNGETGILAYSLPMITVLEKGRIKMKRSGRWMEALGAEGFVTVMRDGVTLLTEYCEWPHENGEDTNREYPVGDALKKRRSYNEYKAAKARIATEFSKLSDKNGEID